MDDLILSDCDKYLVDIHRVYKDKSTGYYRIYFNKNNYKYLHRFIIKANKGEIVDHINRNKADNRRENLRIVSRSLNNYNRDVININGRGIYFDKHGNRFRACISFEGKTIKLGSFKSIKAAKKAYNDKSKEIYGINAYQHKI